jgi:hypothetical protein
MSDAKPNPAELDERARKLHAWFCRATCQDLPLHMNNLRAWMDWLMAGFNGKQMALVIRYLRREIQAGRRNHGALSLRALLELSTFEKDLGLAQMTAGGGLDPDRRFSAPPDAENAPTARPVRAATPRRSAPTQPTADEIARRNAEFARLRKEL